MFSDAIVEDLSVFAIGCRLNDLKVIDSIVVVVVAVVAAAAVQITKSQHLNFRLK